MTSFRTPSTAQGGSLLQARQLVSERTSCVVGIVVGREVLRSVVVIYPNGQAMVAPVVGRYFWTFGPRLGSALRPLIYQRLLGVSVHAHLIFNS